MQYMSEVIVLKVLDVPPKFIIKALSVATDTYRNTNNKIQTIRYILIFVLYLKKHPKYDPST